MRQDLILFALSALLSFPATIAQNTTPTSAVTVTSTLVASHSTLITSTKASASTGSVTPQLDPERGGGGVQGGDGDVGSASGGVDSDAGAEGSDTGAAGMSTGGVIGLGVGIGIVVLIIGQLHALLVLNII
jgi:hypothetical protein